MRTNNSLNCSPAFMIREQIRQKRVPMAQFISDMRMPEWKVTMLLNGKIKITPKIAKRLESSLKVPSSYWLSLEELYSEKRREIRLRAIRYFNSTVQSAFHNLMEELR